MAKGISLHIALNEISSNVYGGPYRLKGCINDANAMEGIAKKQGYAERKILVNKNATLKNVVDEIKRVASILENGDIFFITYSGHGSTVKDRNNDENDGNDETWCLYDGMLVDDTLGYLWTLFKEGVRVIMLSDSCHSGTMLKSGPSLEGEGKNRFIDSEVAKSVYKSRKTPNSKLSRGNDTIKCTVKFISACQDNQVSLDGIKNGLFTANLLTVWRNGNFKGSYGDLYNGILRIMPKTQTPNYVTIGKENKKFDTEIAFSI